MKTDGPFDVDYKDFHKSVEELSDSFAEFPRPVVTPAAHSFASEGQLISNPKRLATWLQV